MDAALSDAIMKALVRRYGVIDPPLDYRNLYQLTIAVVLSAQTTDRQVNAATPELFARYPDFGNLSRARHRDVERIIRSTGFFRHKAAHIISLSRIIMERFGGSVPGAFEELVSLPGIGRKSANVILLMGFDLPAFPVDTHIFRIGNRLGYARSRREIDVERGLMEYIPPRLWKQAHLLLITHGRTICRARNPLCGSCPVRECCESAPRYLEGAGTRDR